MSELESIKKELTVLKGTIEREAKKSNLSQYIIIALLGLIAGLLFASNL